MYKTTVLAVAAGVAAALMWSAPAHAAPTCTALANNPATMNQYKPCVNNLGGWCRWVGVGAFGGLAGGTTHVTCFYPDNSRDECQLTGVAWTNQWDSHCDWFGPEA